MNAIYGAIVINVLNTMAILAYVLKQHKTLVRLKDQHRAMYIKYCEDHRIPFQELENGHS
jgi:hypothetical protein